MSGIKFYSESDMACGFELGNIIKHIKENYIEKEFNIIDVLEFYNTLKYFEFQRFKEYVVKDTEIDIEDYIKAIKKKIGIFISMNKESYLDFFDAVDFNYQEDFFHIFEIYKLYSVIDIKRFERFLNEDELYFGIILRNRKIVNTYDYVIKQKIISNPINAEIVLSKYLKEEELYLPQSLKNNEIDRLLLEYINSNVTNINHLRDIVNYPSNNDLTISDKIKLQAKRKLVIEEERIFSGNSSIVTGVSISYQEDQTEAIKIDMKGMEASISISRMWIEENLDYNTLWNNFIYIFNFVDLKMRLTLDSKRSECGVLESVMLPNAEHIYLDSFAFKFKELSSNAEIISYSEVLKIYGIKLEDMIEWFFHVYLPKEFNVTDFVVKMPSKNTPYFEKCRTILPEIDRILKQYDMFIEDGKIEQELLQMSSSHLFFKDCDSLNERKYIYPSSEWYKTASYLLFSDQSAIFYLPRREKQHKNFFELIFREKVSKNEFNEYQISRMKWLFDNNLIGEDENGFIYFVNTIKLLILKEFYYNEVLSYWHYGTETRQVIDDLLKQKLVCEEKSLFSRNEQDYLNFYLNKSKFANGHDIRNRYLHGTNTNDEEQYKFDYYTIIKLLIIIIIKINDDLCTNKDYSDKSQRNDLNSCIC